MSHAETLLRYNCGACDRLIRLASYYGQRKANKRGDLGMDETSREGFPNCANTSLPLYNYLEWNALVVNNVRVPAQNFFKSKF